MKDTDMVQTKQKEVTDNHNRFTSLEENKKYTEQLYSQSIATQVPVLGDFLVHVSEKTNENVVFIDQPFFMKVFKNNFNLSKGWYHIHALLEAMDDFEKKRTGISLNKKAALITIQEAIMCKEQFCTNQ